MKLKNKVILVTGASKGIGKAIAILLSKKGASVIINYNNSQQEAKNLVNQLTKEGHKVVCMRADVSNPSEAKDLVKKAIEKYGKLDILINNAGVYIRKGFQEVDENSWRSTIDTNLGGTFFCSQEAIKHMLDSGQGAVINIASDAGIFPKKVVGIDYALSKAGIIYLTRSLAVSYSMIKVYGVAPSYTDTGMINSRPLEDKNSPEDVAKLILDLLTGERKANSGEILVIKKEKSLTKVEHY